MQDLTQEDRARLADTSHSIQSAAANLMKIDARKIPNLAEMKACLQEVEGTLKKTLRAFQPQRAHTDEL